MSLDTILFLIPAAAILILPFLLLRRESPSRAETPGGLRTLEKAYERALRAMKDLEYDHQAGTLSEEEYLKIRGEYKEKAVAVRSTLDRARQGVVRRILDGGKLGLDQRDESRIEALVAQVRSRMKS